MKQLFGESHFEHKAKQAQSVTVLGMTFNSDEQRRAYFREELRKKLPELKQIEGFPIGEDDDILNLSDPPYYTACPNPWLNDFIAEWEEEKKELEKKGERNKKHNVNKPYAEDVSEGKYNDIYFKHPYHTKVPIAAITEYLKHYVQNGDIVYDGFAGTGMTGLAAQLLDMNLKSITIDLSSIASFINYGYNFPAKINEIQKNYNDCMCLVKANLRWLYETKHINGEKGIINSVIWSDVLVCNNCGEDIIFWESGVDQELGKVLPKIKCKHCSCLFQKNELKKKIITYYDVDLNKTVFISKIIPVQISYDFGSKTFYKLPDQEDIDRLYKIENTPIEGWIPTYEIPDGKETHRLFKDGINHVNQLYFKRSLRVLSEFRRYATYLPLLHILTAVAFRITKRYALTYQSGKWGAGGGPTNGTYYIPSLIKELNMFDMLDNSLKKYIKADFNSSRNSAISTQSSTVIQIKDNSVDYIFTDPPFGSNFIYSELNYIWESWLKVFTKNTSEAIECQVYNKSLFEYKMLMTISFKEAFRILKPGKWMTVEFSNTKASVWNVIQQSIQEVGFIVANVAALDKQKGSFNAQTTVTAVKQDLVISCYKPSSEFDKKFQESQYNNVGVWDFVEEHLHHLPVHIVKDNATTAVIERSPKILFDRLIAFYIQRSLPVPMDAGDFQKGLHERFIERDGMYFTGTQASEYDEKKKAIPEFHALSLFVSSEQDGIMWLKNELKNNPHTYQDLQPKWMQAIAGLRKGDILPELRDILQENFLQNDKGEWYLPDLENEIDLEKLRTNRLLKQFAAYKEQAGKPKSKLKEVRVEALRVGFKQCYKDKDFLSIVTVAEKIPNNLLMEDEVLLQYYDIAITRVDR